MLDVQSANRSGNNDISKSRSNVNESYARTSQTSQKTSKVNEGIFTVPSLSLPKGGGALRSIGGEFSVNAVNGTGNIRVPIFTSPGRSGFDPKLSLNYDSGSGNGPFGLGWSLSLPSITRKTEKGLPRYNDDTGNGFEENDIFVLSGAEDLVPVLDDSQEHMIDSETIEGFEVHFYRPRFEGLFARIERWVNKETGEQHWRTISKDNITSLYGRSEESRIADPENRKRIFTWSICESFDDKGNAILYKYKSENAEDIDVNAIYELNRTERSANIYLKKIFYGRRVPYFPYENIDDILDENDFMFELVFDFGENYYVENVANPSDGSSTLVTRHEDAQNGLNTWPARSDQFSNYRPGFEIRTSRLCRSIKMIHHFPEHLGHVNDNNELIPADDYVVASTDLIYDENPISSFLSSITHSSYLSKGEGGSSTYLKKSLPPLEFEYSKPDRDNTVHTIDDEYLENLPSAIGAEGYYQWIDLDGEGLNGILVKQGGEWYYKRNISSSDSIFPIIGDNSGGNGNNDGRIRARFAPIDKINWIPSVVKGEAVGSNTAGRFQLMDLAGDGKLDLVQFEASGNVSGIFERTDKSNWDQFVSFKSIPNIRWNDPNLRFVDLTGDGLADILITEHQAFTCYKSLGEQGFEFAKTINQTLDEEKGPRVVFADATQSIFLADMSGDGLTDITRIRNGEICYWPNLGYGRFGKKVTMDNSPWFDNPDYFNRQRIRLADIDGSGLTDIVYLGRDHVSIYLNQSGNGWTNSDVIEHFPAVDDFSSVAVIDLLGTGTAALVWSSQLPSNTRRNIRYIELTRGIKPNIMTLIRNNMGAETHIIYAPSTKFYIQDKLQGRPWVTKLPFVVHVVERVDIHDHISQNLFVTQYAYHHGFFDGVERSFNGFGMVETKDTLDFEIFKDLVDDENGNEANNFDESSHVPPAVTKTWYHHGAYTTGSHIERMFAEREYYHADEQFSAVLLEDTVIPFSLTAEEEREACRALKGSILRTEVYAEDGTTASEHPYVVTEHNYIIKKLQPIAAGNKNGVFLVSPRETITYNYERTPRDPRTVHNLVIDVDEFGNARKSVSIAYGRDPAAEFHTDLSEEDQETQKQILATYTENAYTRLSILADTHPEDEADRYTRLLNLQELENVYRTPVLSESKVYELPGLTFDNNGSFQNNGIRFDFRAIEEAFMLEPITIQKNLIEDSRSVFRKGDLTGPLELGQLDTSGLPFQKYVLAFTPELIQDVYEDRVTDTMLSDDGGYVQFAEDQNGWWWIPSTKIFYSPDPAHSAADELDFARQHFFTPHRFEDPFGNTNILAYDNRTLLLQETRDPLDNVVGATALDYRVLQPSLVTDPNGNRAEVAFDTFGFVTGTAIRGKVDDVGDSLDGFESDLEVEDPLVDPHNLLSGATSRMVYDLFKFKNSSQDEIPRPNVISTILRETHVSDLLQGQQTEVQLAFSYFDGFGREIQKKIQAEPGTVNGVGHIDSRWVGSGWTIFNNKGKAVKKFEPFFDVDHHFKFARIEGVSPTIFFDPIERVVGTIYPNNTFDKTIYNNWFQESWDQNDTVLESDPRNDGVLGDYFRRLYPEAVDYESWHAKRIDGLMEGVDDPVSEQHAAERASVHANTFSMSHVDSLGRVFLVVADNGDFGKYSTRTELDIKGNQISITDPKDRKVVLYSYNMAGNRIKELNMDSGGRWVLDDVQGNPIYRWDSRGFRRYLAYDSLRRPERLLVVDNAGHEFLAEETIYGESKDDSEVTNHRLQVWEMRDSAGLIVNELYDFKGNLVLNSRKLLVNVESRVDWAENPLPQMENETFTSSTLYDALNRPVQLIAPHSDRPSARLNIIQRTYNKANLLERIDAWLEQEIEPDNLDPATATQHFVENIDYNEKGQQELIEYGNGVTTSFEYDDLTFRITNLRTVREGEDLQNLSYFYDPVGNITSIRDDALQTIFFNGEIVGPDSEYVYDPIYRLIEARGREHMGQASQPHTTWNDKFRISQAHPNDEQKMRNYSELYEYDEVGNIFRVDHNAVDGNWVREYRYNQPSLTEPVSNTSNRLSETIIHPNAQTPITEQYTPYDEHGCMTTMPHIEQMNYDFGDHLHSVNLGGGGNAFYVYDTEGQRVRKIHEHLGALKEERIYLGSFEIYRKYNGNGLVLERETLHMMDDSRRIAFVDSRTIGNDDCPVQSIRYQLSNHLGSSCLELDEEGQIISYEEYYPYGSTSYQAGRHICDLNLRTYRYVGKEREKETGLYYYGARYYVPWLARWTTADPIGLEDGLNLYSFVRNNPILLVDMNGTHGRTRQQLYVNPTTETPDATGPAPLEQEQGKNNEDQDSVQEGPLSSASFVYKEYNTDLGGSYTLGGNFDFEIDSEKGEATATFVYDYEYNGNFSQSEKEKLDKRLQDAVDAWDKAATIQLEDPNTGEKLDISLRFRAVRSELPFVRHKKIDVFNAGEPTVAIHAILGYETEIVAEDVNLYINTGFRTMAHELGHVFALEDEYKMSVAQSLLPSSSRTLKEALILPLLSTVYSKSYDTDVSLTTGLERDKDSLMNQGMEFRERYFHHFRDKISEEYEKRTGVNLKAKVVLNKQSI